MAEFHVNDTKSLMRLCKFLASLSAYDNLDVSQPVRIYTDGSGELLAFEGVLYKLVWVNSKHSLSEIAAVIDNFTVMSFSEFRNKIYAMA